MPVQPLPDNPSLENLRKQAKGLRKAASASEPDALARVREFHPRPDEALQKFSLHDAHLVIARSHGFASWSKLKKYLEVVDQHSWLPTQPAGEEPLSRSLPSPGLPDVPRRSSLAARRGKGAARGPSLAQSRKHLHGGSGRRRSRRTGNARGESGTRQSARRTPPLGAPALCSLFPAQQRGGRAIPHWKSRVCCWHTKPTRTPAFSGMAATFSPP